MAGLKINKDLDLRRYGKNLYTKALKSGGNSDTGGNSGGSNGGSASEEAFLFRALTIINSTEYFYFDENKEYPSYVLSAVIG